MNKKKNIFTNLIIFITTIFFMISPLFLGLHRNFYHNQLTIILTFFIIIYVIYIIINKIKITFNKQDNLIFLFSLIYFISGIFNKETLCFAFYHFLICIFVILLSKVMINKENKEKFLHIIMLSSFTVSLFSIISTYLPNIFSNIGLQTFYGDFFPTSIYRVYGLLKYPNATALISLIGLIISIFEYDRNNKLHKLIIYINILTILLTISKTIIILFIISLIIFEIFNWKTKKRKEINTLLLSLFIPISITVKYYHISYLSLNIIHFLIITIISSSIFYLINYILTKYSNKTYIKPIIIAIYIILLLNPIPKTLKVNKSLNNNKIILTDIYDLKKETDYELIIKYKTNKNIKISLDSFIETYSFILPSNSINSTLLPNENTAHFKFKTNKNFEYYYLSLDYEMWTEFNIENLTLINANNQEKKKIFLNYTILPSTYINMFNSFAYDKTSVNGRIGAYKDSLDLIKQNPIVGNGHNYFEKTINTHTYNHTAIEEHSYIMKLLVETGIIGLIIFSILITYTILIIIRNIKNKDIITVSTIFLVIILSGIIDFTLSYQYILIILLIMTYYIKSYDQDKNLVLFISSSGGHLTEILEFSKLFEKYNYLIITEKNKISTKLKDNYNIKFLFYCSRYYLLQYIFIAPINIILSIYYFLILNPKVIVTTGAHTCIPICILGKIFNKKIIFIEVFDRIEIPTLSGKIVYKLNLADTFIVQHKELCNYYKNATLIEGDKK